MARTGRLMIAPPQPPAASPAGPTLAMALSVVIALLTVWVAIASYLCNWPIEFLVGTPRGAVLRRPAAPGPPGAAPRPPAPVP